MIAVFELSMPSVGSWNGKWTAADDYHSIVRWVKPMPENDYYRHNFGDGWSAGISVKQVDSKEATKIRRKSKGFCGYEWMVQSILDNGKIIITEG